MTAEPRQRFSRRRFLFSGTGRPYILLPFIPIAIALELAHAEATVIFAASSGTSSS